METALTTIQDMQMGARAIAASGLFGLKTPDQALALMLVAQAEGYPAALAARDYHVIQGRPALKADAMLARFQSSGGKVSWDEYTDVKVAATFAHPQGGAIRIEWTMDRAKAANLTGKDNWRQYPRQMLRARVISEGIRTVFPGCVCGTYTPEEVADMDPVQTPPRETTATVIDSAPPAPAAPSAPPADTQPVPPAAPAPAHAAVQTPANGVIVEGVPVVCEARSGTSTKTGKPWTLWKWRIAGEDGKETEVGTFSESLNNDLHLAHESMMALVIRCKPTAKGGLDVVSFTAAAPAPAQEALHF